MIETNLADDVISYHSNDQIENSRIEIQIMLLMPKL